MFLIGRCEKPWILREVFRQGKIYCRWQGRPTHGASSSVLEWLRIGGAHAGAPEID
jgi:hypothetical protein